MTTFPFGYRGDSCVLPGEELPDPNLCRHCERHDRGSDGLCSRCQDNLDAQTYCSDVAALVKAARAHLSLWNHWPSDLGRIVECFPDVEEAA